MAIAVATVTRFEIAVITGLCAIEYPITTILDELAGVPGLNARIPRFRLACGRATVRWFAISIIARFAVLHLTVAAHWGRS